MKHTDYLRQKIRDLEVQLAAAPAPTAVQLAALDAAEDAVKAAKEIRDVLRASVNASQAARGALLLRLEWAQNDLRNNLAPGEEP